MSINNVAINGEITKGVSNGEDEEKALLRNDDLLDSFLLSDSTTIHSSLYKTETWEDAAMQSVSLENQPSMDRNSSTVEAGWNVANMVQGTGTLGIPFALMLSGVYGIAIMAIVGVLTYYTGVILVECMYQDSKTRVGLRKRVRVSFPDIGHAVWPRFGRGLVSFVLFTNMAGNSIMYLILLSTSASHLLPHWPISVSQWAVIWALLCLPSAFFRRMSYISWISFLAVTSLTISMTVVVIYCVLNYRSWHLHNITLDFDSEKCAIAFGIITFTNNAHTIFPGVEATMKKPQRYNTMLAWAFFIGTVLKLILGVFPVFLFGTGTLQSVTNNAAGVHIFGPIVVCSVSLSAFCTFPLNQFVMNGAFDDALLFQHFQFFMRGRRYHWFYLVITRTIMVLSVLFLAVVVPQFGLVIGFSGSLVSSLLVFIFPCAFHLKLKYNYLRWYHKALDMFLIFLGIFTAVVGVYSSGKALAKASTL